MTEIWEGPLELIFYSWATDALCPCPSKAKMHIHIRFSVTYYFCRWINSDFMLTQFPSENAAIRILEKEHFCVGDTTTKTQDKCDNNN